MRGELGLLLSLCNVSFVRSKPVIKVHLGREPWIREHDLHNFSSVIIADPRAMEAFQTQWGQI